MDENTDPAVIGALIRLRKVNRSMLHYPLDHRHIALTFRRLVKSGIEYNPEHIHEWLEQPALHAKRIAEYEKDIATVKDYPASVIDDWRNKGREHM